MFLKQYYLACLAHASYLIADEKTGTAVVVDPQRDVDGYFADAEAKGFRIEHVFLTHFHADFLAGHLEIAGRTGAKIHVGARGQTEYDAVALHDGDTYTWGDLRLSILETPGHTPEGVSIVVWDLAASADRPHAVLTGDTLFIGDVGRPDLMASIGVTAEELGGMLYDSLHDKLMKLPDETLVYPAHGAGSMCGKNLSKDTVSTIGEQKKVNYALQPMPKDEFIRLVASEQPRAPRYFAYDAKLNRSERGVLDDVLEELVAIPLERALELASDKNAQIVDTRDAEDWAAGHLRGAFHIGLEGKYATWAGTILDASRPIIVLADAGKEREAAMRLGRIGFDRILGWVDGGIGAVARREDLFAVVERVNPGDLAKRLAPEAVVIVDVRTEKEFEGGHAVGAVNLPLDRLGEGLDELPRDRTLALQCRTGYRSAVAAALLERAGFARLLDQRGGFVAWSEAGCPVEAPVGGGGCTR